ncbi:MAG: 50S ribosomal protein L4 [Candidatus Hydrogenedentes bacterium]|nr:50S ribosomal protein L4 [Candidatus Hydrogenedentota bacterium]
MATAKLVNMDGSELGAVELNDAIFSVAPNQTLVHEAVVALQNARRQGNAATKTRGEVRGGGRKPYRQKGTGRARHGSIREAQMRGGGTVWGPHARSYRQNVSTIVKQKALCCALSERVRGGALRVLDALECARPKTKPFVTMMQRIVPDARKALVVTGDLERNVVLSARNLKGVSVCRASDVNALDVLTASQVVLVKDALPKLEERLL